MNKEIHEAIDELIDAGALSEKATLADYINLVHHQKTWTMLKKIEFSLLLLVALILIVIVKISV